MPWSVGSFSRFYGAVGWQTDLANNIYILASRHDTHDQDMADGVNACLTRDNQSKPTASFLPASNNAYDLGSASFIWRRIYGIHYSDGIRYDTTAAETAAVVTPVNFSFPPGAFRRYGMDPLGVSTSTAAFVTACSCNDYVYDDYPGGGTYLFNTEAVVPSYPLKVIGLMRGTIGVGTGAGTIFKAGAAMGAGKAVVSFTGFADLHIEGFKVLINNSAGQGYIGFKFAELRSSYIGKNSIFGIGSTADDTIGISFTGTGTFTGGVKVDNNYISNHLNGIKCDNSITDMMIINNTIYGTAAHTTSVGINIAHANCNGLMIIGNSFNIWKRSIKSVGSGIKQVGNRFEDANPQWEWVSGSATKHQSIGDTYIGGGVPIYDKTDTASHIVTADNFFSAQNVTNTRGYIEGNSTNARTFAMGYAQVVTFAAGNFTGSGAMTWTVTVGQVQYFAYSIVGKTMTVWCNIVNSTTGGTAGTALQIAIPGGFQAGANIQGSCVIENGGVFTSVGSWTVALGSPTIIKVFIDAAAATNWTLSATAGLSGVFVFPVA